MNFTDMWSDVDQQRSAATAAGANLSGGGLSPETCAEGTIFYKKNLKTLDGYELRFLPPFQNKLLTTVMRTWLGPTAHIYPTGLLPVMENPYINFLSKIENGSNQALKAALSRAKTVGADYNSRSKQGAIGLYDMMDIALPCVFMKNGDIVSKPVILVLSETDANKIRAISQKKQYVAACGEHSIFSRKKGLSVCFEFEKQKKGSKEYETLTFTGSLLGTNDLPDSFFKQNGKSWEFAFTYYILKDYYTYNHVNYFKAAVKEYLGSPSGGEVKMSDFKRDEEEVNTDLASFFMDDIPALGFPDFYNENKTIGDTLNSADDELSFEDDGGTTNNITLDDDGDDMFEID